MVELKHGVVASMVAVEWSQLPKVPQDSPVLVLEVASDGVWVGGLAGLGHLSFDGGWSPCSMGHRLRAVFALAESSNTLIAAGSGGVARSVDRGLTWLHGRGLESETILNLALSPEFQQDSTILAGSVGGGVFRSADGGLTWSDARYGIEAADVHDLLWWNEQIVLASTSGGLYGSRNEGRSWYLLTRQEFTFLRTCGESVAATGQDGSIWRSDSSGERWQVWGALPADVDLQAIDVLANGAMLIGTSDHGVFRSIDGAGWTHCGEQHPLTIAAGEGTAYVGTATGIFQYLESEPTWRHIGSPSLLDYRRVHMRDEAIFVSGALSAPQRWTASEGWDVLDSCPLPVRVFAFGWDGEVLAATHNGVFVSFDSGSSWSQRSDEAGGDLLTLRDDGVGWMATADGSRLLVTHDRGWTWATRPSPFGVLPVVALQAPRIADGAPLTAVTFDASQQSATLWRSFNDGDTWERGTTALTAWAEVATLADPLAVSIGEAIVLQGPDGAWMRTVPGGGGVRRLASSGMALAALTQGGVYIKRPDDVEWVDVWRSEGADRVLDIDLDGASLVALLTGGEVQRCDIGSVHDLAPNRG